MAEDRISVGYERERGKNPWIRFIVVPLSFVLGLAMATQTFASIFDYSDALGIHIRHVYFPGMFVYWYWEWGNLYPVEFRVAVSYGMAVSAILLISYLIADRIITQSARGNSKLHGTAHWASPKEIKDCGLLGNDEGVYVGAWKDKTNNLHYLRDNGPSHVLCFAPTRSGKGVGLVLPTLLSWKHSTVVSDLKGELWQLTSGWRKQYANNVVLRFEPGSPESCARWNPLDEVRLGSADETGDIRNLTETLIDTKGKGLEDFWMQSAANLLEAIITHVLYKRERAGTPANMQAIAFFLADPDNPEMKLEDKLKEMVEYGHYKDGSTHRLVSSMGKAMLAKPENERGSVISTMDSVLGIYKDALIARNTEKSDFKIIDIVTFWPSDCAEMRLARERGYIFPGVFNAGGGIGYGLLMKRFFGLPGDVISVTDDGVVINGTRIPNTKPLLRDNQGDPLPRLRFIEYTLKKDEAFFISDHLPRSYDARYFGVQKTYQIVDVLIPVCVW